MTVVEEWPAGHPRVLVTDGWYANLGDVAIALGLERLIREIAPSAAVVHAAYQWDCVGRRIDDLSVAPPLEQLLDLPWTAPAIGWHGDADALVAGADVVVAQGGGYLVEAYEPWGRLAALATVARRGTPVGLVGVSIEPFTTSRGRRLVGGVLRAARTVVTRDAPSQLVARDLGATGVELGCDLALAWLSSPDVAAAYTVADESRRGVSLVLTDHHPTLSARAGVRDLAARVLTAVVDALDDDTPLVACPTVAGLPAVAGEDDDAVLRALVAGLDPRRRAKAESMLSPTPATPADLVERIGRTRALVTMRLHPSLFAAATATPFLLVFGSRRGALYDGTSFAGQVVDTRRPGGADLAVRRVRELVVDTGAPPGWVGSAGPSGDGGEKSAGTTSLPPTFGELCGRLGTTRESLRSLLDSIG